MSNETKTTIFDRHVAAEMAGDLETTLATMTDDPHLINVPTTLGGFGRDGVLAFYRDYLVGQFFPPDVTMSSISRTVGENQIVDELIISFTHTQEVKWMLPGIAPTGKRVEAAFAVIAGVQDGKISHEHIYWDQASVLHQLGLLPAGLPVVGPENARAILAATERSSRP